MAVSVVTISPTEVLEFDSKEKWLKITNISDKSVCFKVKTTAPKSYVVRPSNDILPAGQSVEVKIALQTSNMAEIASHRFMVQATPVSGEENLAKEQWSSLSKTDIQEFRLAVSAGGGGGVDAKGSSETTGTAGGSSTSGGSTSARSDIQQKYEELVKYTVKLEEETLALQKEKETLEKASKGGGQVLFAWYHLLLAMLIAVACSKMSSLGGMN